MWIGTGGLPRRKGLTSEDRLQKGRSAAESWAWEARRGVGRPRRGVMKWCHDPVPAVLRREPPARERPMGGVHPDANANGLPGGGDEGVPAVGRTRATAGAVPSSHVRNR